MHVWFRQYAQQMGMQNVRAILPEQIDSLINTSITDTINQLIREHIGNTNDRVITDNSKLGQINAFKPLYKDYIVDLTRLGEDVVRFEVKFNSSYCRTALTPINNNTIGTLQFNINYTDDQDNPLSFSNEITVDIKKFNELSFIQNVGVIFTAFKELVNKTVDDASSSVNKEGNLSEAYIIDIRNTLNNPTISCTLTINGSSQSVVDVTTYGTITNSTKKVFNAKNHLSGLFNVNVDFDFMYLVDFSVNYVKARSDVDNNYYHDNITPTPNYSYITNLFPVRAIADSYLADTLNDFILKPRLRTPVLNIVNDTQYNLYFGAMQEMVDGYYRFENNLIPYQFRISYIKYPNKVKYQSDVYGENVNCDLPESMHVDILKHAVDLYRVSVTGSLYATQQQADNANRENVRNNYRNEQN